MKKHKTLFALILLIQASSSLADDQTPAKAGTEQKRESYASALAGAGIGTSAGGDNFFTFSGRVGTGLFSDNSGIFSLGIFVNRSANSATATNISISGTAVPIAAELISRKCFGTGLYAGGRIGVALENLGVTNTQTHASVSASATSLAIGPVAGYEFAISPALNIDLDVSWLSIGGATFNFPGVATALQTNGSSALLIQGGISFDW